MPKKTLITIVVAVLIIFSLGFYVILTRSKTTPATNNPATDASGFPLGTNNPLTGLIETAATSTGTGVPNGKSTRIFPNVQNVSDHPTAGGYVYTKDGKPVVRYAQRDNGNVFEYTIPTSNTIRISNTTIPDIYEAQWATEKRGILRYAGSQASTIQTSMFSFASSTATSTSSSTIQALVRRLFPADITTLSISPAKTKVFYLSPDGSGIAGVVTTIDGTKSTTIFRSPLKEWRTEWPQETTIALTTKPSSEVPGYLYFLNATTGNLEQILAGIHGLTTLTSPTRNAVLYFDAANNSLNIHKIKENINVPVSIQTLPEKCVWSKAGDSLYCASSGSISGEMPDAWYQGLTSFADSIWKIDQTGAATLVSGLRTTTGGAIDAIDLSLSPTEDYLLFSNKKDFTLWTLKLTP